MKKQRITICVALVASLFIGLFMRPCFSEAKAESNRDDSLVVVSMGDSYSSGEGLEPFIGQNDRNRRTNQDWLSHRSERSWPGRLQFERNNRCYSLNDKRCALGEKNEDISWYFTAVSGATTYDLLGKTEMKKKDHTNLYDDIMHGPVTIDPQINVFDKIERGTVDYVTLTIGGNDAYFADIISKCATSLPWQNPNRINEYLDEIWREYNIGKYYIIDKKVIDELDKKSELVLVKEINENSEIIFRRFVELYGTEKAEEKLNSPWNFREKIEVLYGTKISIKERIIETYRTISEKAGSQASIIVAGYPTLLGPNSWVFSKTEVKAVNNAVRAFNAELEGLVNQCSKEGIKIYFVSVDKPEYFQGHEAYTEDPYINPIQLVRGGDLEGPISAGTMHPNGNGAQAYAKAVQEMIDFLQTTEQYSGGGRYDEEITAIPNTPILTIEPTLTVTPTPLYLPTSTVSPIPTNTPSPTSTPMIIPSSANDNYRVESTTEEVLVEKIHETYLDEDSPVVRECYKYDETGHLVEIVEYDIQNKVFDRIAVAEYGSTRKLDHFNDDGECYCWEIEQRDWYGNPTLKSLYFTREQTCASLREWKYYYDQYGSVVKSTSIEYGRRGQILSFEYQRDTQDRIVQKTVMEQGQIKETEEYTYDLGGSYTVTCKGANGELLSISDYNETGHVLREELYISDQNGNSGCIGVDTYEYKTISVVTKIPQSIPQKDAKTKTVRTKMVAHGTYKEKPDSTLVVSYEYDTKGREVCRTVEDEEGQLLYIYDYDYDWYNNVIKKTKRPEKNSDEKQEDYTYWYSYADDGSILSKASWEEINRKCVSEQYENGFLMSEFSGDSLGNFDKEINYVYDEDGRKVLMIVRNTKYLMDDYGQVTSDIFHIVDTIYDYRYDNQGYLSVEYEAGWREYSITLYNHESTSDGLTHIVKKHYNHNGKLGEIDESWYNEQGKIVSEKTYWGNDKEYRQEFYEYDSSNNLVKYSIYHEDGIQSWYEYFYDTIQIN